MNVPLCRWSVRVSFAHAVVAFWWLAVASALAHDPGLSTAQVRVVTPEIEVSITWALKDAAVLADAVDAVGEEIGTSPALVAGVLGRHAREVVEVTLDGGPVPPSGTSAAADLQGNVTMVLHFAGTNARALVVRSAWLSLLPPGHRQLVTVVGAGPETAPEQLLSARANTVAIAFQAPLEAGGSADSPAPTPTKVSTRFLNFLGLGLKHILIGYDHLLFLFSLLIVSRRLDETLKVITSFTVAHSVTLALATLNWVRLPSRVVEPLIAASIVFVALENLLRRELPQGRWRLVFGFGLIHGLGFASVLQDLGVGADGRGVGLPLFSFNLGVELGQLLVALPLMPIISLAARRPEFGRRWAPACSVIAAGAGLVWFVERILG